MMDWIRKTMVSGCLLLVAGCATLDGTSPPPSDDASVGQVCSVMASVPYWVQEEAIASFEKNIDLIDSIAVFWYHLAPDGKVRKYVEAAEDRALIEHAHRHGVKVLALVANLPDSDLADDQGNWDAARVGRVIGSAAARSAHVEDLMDLTRRLHFDGIYLDYEELPGKYREHFTLFVEELAEALHAEDKTLAVALHPKTSENDPLEDNGSAAQDWNALHAYADQLHFMAYSQHTAETAPGPVASAGWVERVLRYAVVTRRVPPAKIYMGVPLYAEEWYQTPQGRYRGIDGDLVFSDVQKRKRKHDGTEKWSAKHASPYVVYRDQKYRKHVIWFENRRSSEEKLAIASELGICKLSLWRLGGEDPRFWDLVREQRAGARAPAAESSDPENRDGDENADENADENEANDEQDDEGSTSSTQEGSAAWWTWARWRGHLGLSGQTSASMELYTAFAATDPGSERSNGLVYMDSAQELALTSRLRVDSEVRLVLESDGEDPLFYTDFPHEGLYVTSLLLRYGTDRYSIFAGKYEPAFVIRGYAPIFFGNHSLDLQLARRLGAGASATLAHTAIGRHTLTGHVFHADTTRLSGEVFTGRDRNRSPAGSLATTGRPDSHLITLDGGSADPETGIAYTLGWGRQRNGNPTALDEHIYLGALKGTVPLGRYGSLTPSLDVLGLRNADGQPVNTHNLLFGLAYAGSAFSLGGAYSIRFVDPGPAHDRRRDLIAEILARYELGRGLWTEAAYQHLREGGEQNNFFGIVLGYMRDWALL
jgi:spore germination protein